MPGRTPKKVAMTAPTPPTEPTPGDPAPATTEPATTEPAEQPLGPAGKKALDAEREARKALEKQLADLAPLKQLAELIRGGEQAPSGKSEVDLLNEKFGRYEQDLAAEREARWRAEVAQEKGLTAQQAARLTGASREDLAADADALLALFPAAGPRTPAPDPTQGARGPVDIDQQIRDAEASGDSREAIRLKRQRLYQN
jgi:hypothetical protein